MILPLLITCTVAAFIYFATMTHSRVPYYVALYTTISIVALFVFTILRFVIKKLHV